jgi:hypothetical protein
MRSNLTPRRWGAAKISLRSLCQKKLNAKTTEKPGVLCVAIFEARGQGEEHPFLRLWRVLLRRPVSED